MNKIKKIFFWSPHINNQIATVKAVQNSVEGMKKFGSSKYKPVIINVFGEWNEYKKKLNKIDVEYIDLLKLNIKLPINGVFKSRFFYIIISLLTFPKLFFIIKKHEPDFIIGHLIVTPILVLSHFFNKNKIKFVLRISGLPHFNFFRKNFWKLFGTKLYCITCPTKSTKKLLLYENIFEENKIFVLEDPIFKISNIRVLKKNFCMDKKKNDLIAVGRLTNQKNFTFLIKGFSKVEKDFPSYNLKIIGSGEKEQELKELIKDLSLEKRVSIIPFSEKIYDFYLNSEILISTALWEDPGFAILEAAMFNLTILSSNCLSGPKEFLENDRRGYGFISNDIDDFEKKLRYLLTNRNSKENYKKKISAKKYCKKFSILNHYLKLGNILN